MPGNITIKRNYIFGIAILSIFAISVLGFFLYGILTDHQTQTQTIVIELSENGFQPEKLTIEKGDTVRFITSTDKFFWPASNLHPTHTAYSEFDPKQPLAQGEAWLFTFEKTGNWNFHDHLTPRLKGTVTVEE